MHAHLPCGRIIRHQNEAKKKEEMLKVFMIGAYPRARFLSRHFLRMSVCELYPLSRTRLIFRLPSLRHPSFLFPYEWSHFERRHPTAGSVCSAQDKPCIALSFFKKHARALKVPLHKCAYNLSPMADQGQIEPFLPKTREKMILA